MRKLTVLTVAFAAGAMTFAANAGETAAKPKTAKVETAVAKKVSGSKSMVGVDCPYLFGCGDKKTDKLDTMTTSSIGRKAANPSKAPSRQAPYNAIIAKYAAAYGVPTSLAHAVIRVESNYRADARGSAGEVGLMQIKPATARMMGYSGSAKGLFNPDTNIKFGMKYLSMAHQLGGGATCTTILKYNAGHAAKRMNKRSSAYCAKVKQHMAGA